MPAGSISGAFFHEEGLEHAQGRDDAGEHGGHDLSAGAGLGAEAGGPVVAWRALRMRVSVLGAAAGGGFPQWNDAGPASRRARAGDAGGTAGDPGFGGAERRRRAAGCWSTQRRTCASRSRPTRSCIRARAPRSSPIAAVLLTNGDVDAVAGLLHLREGTPFALYGHERVLAVLAANPVFEVVRRDLVPRRAAGTGGAGASWPMPRGSRWD